MAANKLVVNICSKLAVCMVVSDKVKGEIIYFVNTAYDEKATWKEHIFTHQMEAI